MAGHLRHAQLPQCGIRVGPPGVRVNRRIHQPKKQVSRDTREQFNQLVTFSDEGYTFTLPPPFQLAISQADAAKNATRGHA